LYDRPPPVNADTLRSFVRLLFPLLPLCIAGLVVLVALGGWRGPAGASVGRIELPGYQNASLTALAFRVGTLNIHGGEGTDGAVDLARTADLLNHRRIDVVALHEVRGLRLGGRTNQAQVLADELGMDAAFAPAERQWFYDHFGNALLARLPVRSIVQLPLPATEPGYRNVILMRAQLGGKDVSILATHLDRGDDRTQQLRATLEIFRSLAPPCVLMGDLNSSAADAQLIDLVRTTDTIDPFAHINKSTWPGRIDWILVRGLRVLDAGFADNGASDHKLLWAELEHAVD